MLARASKVAELVFDLKPHGLMGELRYNEKGFLRANCRYHDCQCRRQRQTTEGKTIWPRAGRPIGALILWLQKQKDHRSQVQHVGRTIGSFTDRRAARNWFKTLPVAQRFLDLERPRMFDEGDDEPQEIK